MPRRVIHLDRDLPVRARPLEASALTKIFGGCAYRGAGCEFFGGNPKCCPGFVCVAVAVNPWLTQKTCAAG